MRPRSYSRLMIGSWLTARPVGLPAGRPIVGVDLGGGRAWERSGSRVGERAHGSYRVRAWHPGRLKIKRSATTSPAGVYTKLMPLTGLSDGLAQGLRVPASECLMGSHLRPLGSAGQDRVRPIQALRAARRCGLRLRTIEPRITQWSSSSADIRALRKICRDGPLSVDPGSRNLLVVSMSAAYVQNDNAGNVRLIKKGHDNKGRDDVAAAATLAAGGVRASGRGAGP